MSRYKFFRVATEGATTDGRIIQRSWLEQAAKNFSTDKYSPRVWLEHIRGIYPDSSFKAYGDVTALEVREVEDGKLALFAQINPTAELVAMNQNRQKLYTSIEINPKFADTGEAYLVGLAVTDTPASLGTEMLQFSAKNGIFDNRKQDVGNLFTEAIAFELEEIFESEEEIEARRSFSEMIKETLQKFRADKKSSVSIVEFSEALNPLIESLVEVENSYEQSKKNYSSLEKSFNQLSKEFSDLKEQIRQSDHDDESFNSSRPTATGEGELVATY